MKERFFILTPTPTGRVMKSPAGSDAQVYLDAEGNEMWWYALFSLPSIGQRIYISMNGIGWASVKGYFVSEGYLGVMTLAENPPKWLVDQRQAAKLEPSYDSEPNWVKEGIGCEFGPEIRLSK